MRCGYKVKGIEMSKFYISTLELYGVEHIRIFSGEDCDFAPPDHWLGTLNERTETFDTAGHDGLTSRELRELADFVDETLKGNNA